MIYRVQRRAYYRVKASLGMELLLRDLENQEYKVRVKDYSIGGWLFIRSWVNGGFRT